MKPRSLARWLSTLGVAALLMVGAASAADVHVMISAGFYGVYSELGPAFERASGHRLVTTRGPSMGDSPEAIPTRLARGETADVVILDGGAADELGKRGLVRAEQQDRARSLADRHGGARRGRKAGHRQRRGTPDARYLRQSLSRTRTAVAAPIYRPRCSPSSASQTRSRARAEKCEGLRPASRWPRSSRVARRRSASNRSAN